MKSLIRQLLYAASFFLAGVASVVVLVYMKMLDGYPDLKPWHSVELTADFHAGMPVDTLSGYLEIEALAFSELEAKILDRTTTQDRFAFNRFYRGSLSDPQSAAINWNRTFEFETANPRGGVLLLHGLSDSPYSLRSIGEQLHARGWQVLGLRMPGHGTAPSALRTFDIRDARAAARIGVRHLRQKLGEHRPILIVGYSNGAALAADYALAAQAHAALPPVDGLIFMSPAFAVDPIAAFAIWQARAGEWFDIDKLAWQTVMPEFDPYKYNSFAVRAGDQVYRLTEQINRQLLEHGDGGAPGAFPPMLVFQSVIDATVQPSAVVNRVLSRVAGQGSSLVLYDVNRLADTEPLYRSNVGAWVEQLHAGATPYAVTLVTNRSSGSGEVVAITRSAGNEETTRERLGLSWPPGVFALSHIAVPFPPDDPVYGSGSNSGELLTLGGIEPRGETGVLAIPPSLLTRLRHNPFHSYQARRIDEFADQFAVKQGKTRN